MAKQYKCTNYGVCSEADKDTLFQEADLEEVDGKYICPKCKQELEPIEKGGGKGKGKLIAIIAAVVVVLVLTLVGKVIIDDWKAGKHTDTNVTEQSAGGEKQDETTSTDTNVTEQPGGDETQDETTSTDTNGTEQPGTPTDPQPGPTTDPQPKQPETAPTGDNLGWGTYNLGWGTYEGHMKSGKPHGIGGEVKVTSSYSIDLKNGSFKQVAKGDTLKNTKFKEGKLVQGYIHHANGEQESFTIGY